jgi:hypothetical protein
MGRVFISDATGVGVYVFSDDHCPPHVHARHRGDGWVLRAKFSYISDVIDLMSITPLKNIPLQRIVNQLLDDIQSHVKPCRRSWWKIRGTTCLTNQWAVLHRSGTIEMSAPDQASAKQIMAAEYDVDKDWLHIVFRDGTAARWET